VALVIGNCDYGNTKVLPNLTNDATDMTAAVQSHGFTFNGGNSLTHTDVSAK
jgi:uncharacterized caspase-like protein